jgi:hypothetical protein
MVRQRWAAPDEFATRSAARPLLETTDRRESEWQGRDQRDAPACIAVRESPARFRNAALVAAAGSSAAPVPRPIFCDFAPSRPILQQSRLLGGPTLPQIDGSAAHIAPAHEHRPLPRQVRAHGEPFPAATLHSDPPPTFIVCSGGKELRSAFPEGDARQGSRSVVGYIGSPTAIPAAGEGSQ